MFEGKINFKVADEKVLTDKSNCASKLDVVMIAHELEEIPMCAKCVGECKIF